jgi:bacterioferritin-associated ferredoxin
MYVCLCNAIKESELRELAHSGVREAHAPYEALGVELNCETCLEHVQEVLDRTLAPANEG